MYVLIGVWFHTDKNMYTWGTTLPLVDSLCEETWWEKPFLQGNHHYMWWLIYCIFYVLYILYTSCDYTMYIHPSVLFFCMYIQFMYLYYVLCSITILSTQCIISYSICFILYNCVNDWDVKWTQIPHRRWRGLWRIGNLWHNSWSNGDLRRKQRNHKTDQSIKTGQSVGLFQHYLLLVMSIKWNLW